MGRLPSFVEQREALHPLVLLGPKICQGRKLVKKVKMLKVLRMGLPTLGNLSGLQESMFSLFGSPPLCLS